MPSIEMSSNAGRKEHDLTQSSLPRAHCTKQGADSRLTSPNWLKKTPVLLFLFALVSCAPVPLDAPPTRETAATTHRDSPTVTPRESENITGMGTSRGSTQERNGAFRMDEETAQRAVDGDIETVWSSEKYPTQWFSISFENPVLMDRAEMVVAQFPAGPTSHEIWVDDGSGVLTLSQRLITAHTEDGQLLQVEIDPPQVTEEVLILTLESPSWVAWRELRIFGAPVSNLTKKDNFELKLARTASGFELPVQVTHAGDGSDRIFVVEQIGRIKVIQNGAVRSEPFMDITSLVSCCQERGLLNIAFSPSFHADQQFYVSYTNTDGNLVISRFAIGDNPNKADLGSEEKLLVVDQPGEIHNGGTIAFGPIDGFLYIGSGEGGLWNHNAGQLPNSLLGKILRIDVSAKEHPYRVPSTNPYAQSDDGLDEIWALGIRNSWGFAFDKLTGDLFLPDAGHSKREEINFQPALSTGGENYGWPVMEGSICFEYWPCSDRVDGFTRPVAEYQRSQGCAIVGGAVYRGSQFAGLQGAFLFADFCSGRIWGLNRPNKNSHGKWQPSLLATASVPVSSIGEDEKGNAYVTGYQDGALYLLEEK